MKIIRLTDAESAIRQARRDLLAALHGLPGGGPERLRGAVLEIEKRAVESMREQAIEPKISRLRKTIRSILRREAGDVLDRSIVHNCAESACDIVRVGSWL